MEEKIKLEQYYSGDEAWYKFVAIAKDAINTADFNTNKDTLELLKEKLSPQEDIAYVAYYFFYNDSINWAERQIPALDYLQPIACLDSKTLTQRLREALLRTPL